MTRILLYSTQFCGYCRAAKNLLRAKSLEYEEIDVGFDPAKRDEMVERAHGARTVPQIFIHGRHIGGDDELAALEREATSTTGSPMRSPVQRRHDLSAE